MTNTKSTNQNSSRWYPALFWLIIIVCLVVAIDGAIRYQQANRHQKAVQQFYQHQAQILQNKANNISDLEDLQQQAQLLQIAAPELDYYVLYQQWLAALNHFDRLVASAENRYVSSDLSHQQHETHQSFLNLRALCDKQLRQIDQLESASDDDRWAIYNLRGAISVMMAYSLIEYSQDSEKSRTFLAEAVEDLKQAIRSVDESAVPPAQRMIPRWNLELIVGAGETMAVGRQLGGDSAEEMRGQLQAVVPNVGGYSPGAPLETRVRK